MDRDTFLVMSHGGTLSRYFDVKEGYTFVLLTESYKCNYMGGYGSSIIKLFNSPGFVKKTCFGKIPAKLLSDIHKTTGTFNDINHICNKTIRKKSVFCRKLNKLISSTNINLRNEQGYHEIRDNIIESFLMSRNPATLYYIWGFQSTPHNYLDQQKYIYNLFIDDIKQLIKLDSSFFDDYEESKLKSLFHKLKLTDFSITDNAAISNLLYFTNLAYMLYKYYSYILCNNLDLEDYQLDFMMQYLQLQSPYDKDTSTHIVQVSYLLQSAKYQFICDVSEDLTEEEKLDYLERFAKATEITYSREQYYKLCRDTKINYDVAFYKKTLLIPGWTVIKNQYNTIGYYFKLNRDIYYRKKSTIIKKTLIIVESANKISEPFDIFARPTIGIPYNTPGNLTAFGQIDDYYDKQQQDAYVTVYGSKSQYDVNYRRMQDMVLLFDPQLTSAIGKSGIYKLPSNELTEFSETAETLTGRREHDVIPLSTLPIELDGGELVEKEDVLNYAYEGSLDLTKPAKSVLGYIWTKGNKAVFDATEMINRVPSMKLSDIQKHYPPGIYFITACRTHVTDVDTKLYDSLGQLITIDTPTPTLSRTSSIKHQALRAKPRH